MQAPAVSHRVFGGALCRNSPTKALVTNMMFKKSTNQPKHWANAGAPLCHIVCLEGPSAATVTEARGSGRGFEPRAWPRTLDVRMRVDVYYVVNTVSGCKPSQHIIRPRLKEVLCREDGERL